MDNHIRTHNLGYPRIGAHRELKKATEAFWKGQRGAGELLSVGRELRTAAWLAQREAGIDLVPSNDFSLYDHVLDTSCLVGNIPRRFHWDGGPIGLNLYFRIARGSREDSESCGCSAHASEMTKWFDTNYHYIVPEFDERTTFKLSSTKPFDEFDEALALGIRTKPVLVGPLTYLHLGKASGCDKLALLDSLLPVYEEVLRRLAAQGAEWVQLDEPILALDLDADWQAAFVAAYSRLRASAPNLRLLLAAYFGELRENLPLATSLPVDAIHLDLTRADELEAALARLPETMSLSLGLVDGRNIWRNDFDRSLRILSRANLPAKRLLIGPSSSLLHAPVSLRTESAMDAELKNWLAFAEEKLGEITALARQANGGNDSLIGYRNRVAIQSRKASERIH